MYPYDETPNTIGQSEPVQPASSDPRSYGQVNNGFLDYLRGMSQLSSPGGQAGARKSYTPSETPNNLGKAAGAASQAGLCGGAGAAGAL